MMVPAKNCILFFAHVDIAMQDVFGAKYVSLHVRVSNKGAHHLYTQSLAYKQAPAPPTLEFIYAAQSDSIAYEFLSFLLRRSLFVLHVLFVI